MLGMETRVLDAAGALVMDSAGALDALPPLKKARVRGVSRFEEVAQSHEFIPYLSSWGGEDRPPGGALHTPVQGGGVHPALQPAPPGLFPGGRRHGGRPYGHYCSGPYGARQQVDSVERAREILQDFFADENVAVGKPVERDGYYEAEILDRNGTLVDKVIVDKRNGRIRSIY